MSFYLCKHAKVEAEPVVLAGEQYYAVAVHGKGHLVHGPAFELMFQVAAEGGELSMDKDDALAAGLPVREPFTDGKGKRVWSRDKNGKRKLKIAKVKAAEVLQAQARLQDLPVTKATHKSAQPKAAPAPATTGKASPLQQKVLDVLALGPLTTADLATMVYIDLDHKTACMNIYPLTAAMKDKGLIVKREDPDAGGLMKWFVVA